MRALIRRFLGPSEQEVNTYLDVLLQATSFTQLLGVAQDLHPQPKDRAYLHSAMWRRASTIERALAGFAALHDMPSFFDDDIDRTPFHMFLTTGHALGVHYARHATHKAKPVVDTITRMFTKHPAAVSVLLPPLLSTFALSYDDATWMVDGVAADDPSFVRALRLAYTAMQGPGGVHGTAAMEKLQPHLVKAVPAGLLDSMVALNLPPMEIFAGVEHYLQQPVQSQGQVDLPPLY